MATAKSLGKCLHSCPRASKQGTQSLQTAPALLDWTKTCIWGIDFTLCQGNVNPGRQRSSPPPCQQAALRPSGQNQLRICKPRHFAPPSFGNDRQMGPLHDEGRSAHLHCSGSPQRAATAWRWSQSWSPESMQRPLLRSCPSRPARRTGTRRWLPLPPAMHRQGCLGS